MAVQLDQNFGSSFGKVGGSTLGSLVSLVVTASMTLAGVVVFFMLLMAGFKMISSAGSGNQDEAAKAKSAVTSGAIGFVVIFTAYWVIRIIELIVGTDFITVPGI